MLYWLRGRWILMTAIAVVFIAYLLSLTPLFGYALHGVKSNEVGIKLQSYKVTSVVGPGIWTDIRPFADIVDVSTEGLDFCVEDPEVLIKKAEQRIGVRVCGRIRRPGVEHDYVSDWAQYRTLYLDNRSIVGEPDPTTNLTGGGVVFSIGSQAMKVCVGDRTFEESVVGSARDALRGCIDTEMSNLADKYGGLVVDNVTVPNVAISPAAQKLMDDITEARLQIDLAMKDALKADAQGQRQLAVEQAGIKVSQGKLQEEQRQKAITANLERLAIEAQKEVIQAQKSNDLTSAELDLKVQTARKLAAEQAALTKYAALEAEASIYTRNPRYASMRVAQDYAAAYKGGEKMVVPGGSDIKLLLGGQAVTPFLNMDAGASPN